MNRIRFSFSNQFATLARLLLLGLVVFALILPAGAQALPKPTPTPTFVTPTLPPTVPPRSPYNWSSVPRSSSELASDRALALLGGQFIFHGLVKAQNCANGGLLSSGAANPCGVWEARNAVILWQNQFDDEIHSVARKTGVPPFVLKNVLIRESQFWPETYRNPKYGGEYGLGHLTLMGADTLLSWNRDFYKRICNQNYGPETCRKEYVFQEASIKAALKGLVLRSIDATCPTCVGGVDLRVARNSISVTAEILVANENYVKWLVKGFAPTANLYPVNVWQFALASYTAGPGCFGQAFYATRGKGNPLSWKDVQGALDKTCKVAIGYVDFVMGEVDTADRATLEAAAKDSALASRMAMLSAGMPLPTFTPNPLATVAPSETPFPTIANTQSVTVTVPAASNTAPAVTQTPATPTNSSTATPTVVISGTPATETPTPAATVTGTPPTETPTLDATATETPSTPESTVTGTPPTETPTLDVTATETPSATASTPEPTVTGTLTFVPTFTDTPVDTSTPEPTVTGTPPTATATLDATVTATLLPATDTPLPSSETPTDAITATPTLTETPAPPTATPIVQPTPFIPTPQDNGEVIVKFGALVPDFLAQSAISSAGGTVEEQVDELGVTIVSAPTDKVDDVVKYLDSSVLVDYVEPNYAVRAFYTPNDPGYVNQNYLTQMQIPDAWDVTKGEGTIVAVIDTGVDVLHPDLASNVWINPGEDGVDANGNDKRTNLIDDDSDGYIDNWMGWNFVDNNNDARDGNGHGTHLAGIIAAQMDNNLGGSGIAPRARILAVKVLDSAGFGTYAQVAQGIIYAVDHGAKVIELGFGGSSDSAAMRDATDYAYAHNVLVVAAGGNTGNQTVIYPAANPHVIGIAALDENLNIATFSSASAAIQLSAPGVGIYSTANGSNYATMSGTSMSSAQVAGVAALLSTQSKFDTPDKLSEALFQTARDLGDPGLDTKYGYGLVQALNALNYIPGAVTPTPTITITPGGPTLTPSPTPGGPTPTPEPGGVSIMVDMAGSSITNYATSCGTGSNPNYGAVTNYTAALGGTVPAGMNVNDGISAAIPIGFDFWYMGTKYTQVIASTNGWLSFAAPGGSYNINDLDNASGSGSGTARPLLAPLWDDLSGTTGTASYTSTGTAPNRTFTFEWWNFSWNSGGAGRISLRVVLHETTGDIDFQYYRNNATAGPSASIGMTGTANTSFMSAQNTNACPTWSTAAETATLNTQPPNNGRYTFSPTQVTLTSPSNVYMTNITGTTFTLNWNDNSTGEDGFGIYTSTDGINYTYVTQAAANATSVAVTGNAANYWRVYAAVEGNASAEADVMAPTALTFTGVSPSSMTLNWTDNSSNETGFFIFRSTDNANFTQVTKTAPGVTSYAVTGLASETTYYWRVQAVGAATAEATITAAAAGSQATSAASGSSMTGSTITTYTTSCTTPGFTALTGGTTPPGSNLQVNNAVTSAIPLGFDFWYMGTKYTQVYASSNGWLSFNSPAGNTCGTNTSCPTNDLDNSTGSNGVTRPFLAPLWDDLSGTGGGTGTATYRTQGTAPSRTFTFEWLNWRWNTGAAGAVESFQVVLYEASGNIDFNYRQDVTGINAGSASIGITGSANTSFLSASNVGACPPNWSSAVETNNLNTKPVNGARYTFTPGVIALNPPSNLQLTNVSNTAVTLNWTDNSNNEDGFGIYTSTDGVNYYYAGQAAANATSTTVNGSFSGNNYWKIFAVAEASASPAAAVTPPSALNFTGITQTGMTLNWTDNSNNETGFYIYKSTDNVNFGNPIVKVPAGTTSYAVSGLTMGVTYYWRVQAVGNATAETTLSAAATGSQATAPNNPPTVTITAPANNSTYVKGVAITFTGTATDPEDGNIAANLQWASSMDGPIGTGATFSKSNLSYGTHTITASATDANGGTGSASITIKITDTNGNVPPALIINTPADLSSYVTGTNITFSGTSIDGPGSGGNTGDGNISSGIRWSSDINGNIGTGASVSTSALSIGVHTITATSTDSGGLSTTRTIRVVVTDLSGNSPPVLTLLSPSNGASFQQGATIGFAANAFVQTSGDISAYITWKESTTTLGTGSSFKLSSLSVGTHNITASVTNLNNSLSSSKTFVVVITASSPPGVSPHDGVNGSSDQCAICHRPHAALDAAGALTNSSASPNDFCLSCHNTDTTVVSTHSNADWVTAGGGNPRFEGQFELLCTQCHSPHGHDTPNSVNLNNTRTNMRLSGVPNGVDDETGDLYPTTGPVIFTATSGVYSFDDGGASGGTPANRMCVTCHNNASNTGYPMTRHPGAANHGDSSGGSTNQNYVGQDCTTCHPHSLDSSTTSRDGFSTTCRACHSMPQQRTSIVGAPARRQIVATFGQSPAASGDFYNRASGGSHHVTGNDAVTDTDCLVCHEMSQHEQGTVRVFDEDTGTVLALNYTNPYPYVLGASDAANYETFCLSCHDANGKNGDTTPFSDQKLVPQIDTSIWSNSQHNVLKTGFNASCLDCHSNGHGSNKTYLQSAFTTSTPWDWAYAGAGASPADVMDQEENFCFKCHTTGGTGTNVQLAFTTGANVNVSGGTPLSYGYRQHNIAATYNVHDSKEVFSSLFGGANRHVECDDCHGPHEDKTGTSAAPTVKPENIGATGVDPVYSGIGAPTRYNFLSSATKDYQICFKCHSSYTTLPTYTPYGWSSALVADGLRKITNTNALQIPDTRDLAKAFNPSNTSFHPVMAVGKNQGMPAAGFTGGWTQTSLMYCADCHTNPITTTGANGPHGSPLLHILTDANSTGTTNYRTVDSAGAKNANEICFKCHSTTTYGPGCAQGAAGSNFANGGTNLHCDRHNSFSCYDCHNTHGSEKEHLIDFNYTAGHVTALTGNSQSAYTHNANGGSCALACHGTTHPPFNYTYP